MVWSLALCLTSSWFIFKLLTIRRNFSNSCLVSFQRFNSVLLLATFFMATRLTNIKIWNQILWKKHIFLQFEKNNAAAVGELTVIDDKTTLDGCNIENFVKTRPFLYYTLCTIWLLLQKKWRFSHIGIFKRYFGRYVFLICLFVKANIVYSYM